ncbi:hypothetical protein IFR05_005405 [Cadophora sp. M221]|nr:hypothetical protein IFR05_005405 [Cadophora sp. M221]
MEALSIFFIAIFFIITILNLETFFYIAIISSLITWAFLHSLEQHQLWTLRFRISLLLPNLILIPTTSTFLLSKVWIRQVFNFSPTDPSVKTRKDNLTFNFSTFLTSKFVDKFNREARASFFPKAWNFSDTTEEAILLLRQIATKVQQVAEHIGYNLPHSLLQIDGALTTLVAIRRICITITTISFIVVLTWCIIPLVMNQRYLRLRRKAWTGHRRSCILPHLTHLISDKEDWKDLARRVKSQLPTQHPVERFSSIFSTTPWRISVNPIDLLKACPNNEKTKKGLPLLKSSTQAGVYQLILNDDTDILALSPSLLTSRPTFGPNLDGRAIYLAYGILSRNKGPRPGTLICNLHTSDTLKIFEENSVQWPRPATCFRSIYRAEFTSTFSVLGDSSIFAATELALLLADTYGDVIEDWLDANMEQQDLKANKKAAELGASAGDLERHYKGQYAAMLVSLADHQRGERIMTEILVYEALCRLEGVDVETQWVSDSLVGEWKEQEVRHVGAAGVALISVII